MYKLILLGALALSATANLSTTKHSLYEYMASTDVITMYNNDGSFVYYKMWTRANIDMGWNTVYKGEEDTTTGKHIEGYGINAYSYVNFTIGCEWMQWYRHEYMFSLVPWSITPY